MVGHSQTGGEGSASIITLKYYNHIFGSLHMPYSPAYTLNTNPSSPKPGIESYLSIEYSIFQKMHCVE